MAPAPALCQEQMGCLSAIQKTVGENYIQMHCKSLCGEEAKGYEEAIRSHPRESLFFPTVIDDQRMIMRQSNILAEVFEEFYTFLLLTD